jgi:hypothetical protein
MSGLVAFPPELYDETAFSQFRPVSGFLLGNALPMMWFAQLAYETEQRTIDRAKNLWQFDRIETIGEHFVFKTGADTPRVFSVDTRGVIGTKGDLMVVAFGGTDALVWQNIVTDADFWPVSGSDTHAGFEAAFNAVEPAFLKALEARPKSLFIAGHSLGAAIASLAALSAAERGFEPTAVYMFGMPRVGGENFASRYKQAKLAEKTYRLVHGLDVVPRVPPTTLKFKFVHVGQMLHCNSGEQFAAGPLAQNNEPTLTAGLASGMLAAIKNAVFTGRILSEKGPGPFGPLFQLLPQPIRDHLQDRYIAALSESWRKKASSLL